MGKIVANYYSDQVFNYLKSDNSDQDKKTKLIDFFNQYAYTRSGFRKDKYEVTEGDLSSLKDSLKKLPNNNQNIALIKLVVGVCYNFTIPYKDEQQMYLMHEEFATSIFQNDFGYRAQVEEINKTNTEIQKKIQELKQELIEQFPEAFPFVNSAFSSQRHNHAQDPAR